MTIDLNRNRWRLAALLLLLLTLFNIRAGARLSDRYTQQRPLVVVCDWDMPPYEFLDDQGQPSGYTIDMLNAIFSKLDVEYVYEMVEHSQAQYYFKQRKADVIIAPDNMLSQLGCRVSTAVLSYYRPKIVMQSSARPVNSLNHVGAGKVVVVRPGENILSMTGGVSLPFTIERHAPMEALAGVSSGKYDYFVWSEASLTWKIKELNLENLMICDLDVPFSEVHVGAFDEELINAIDDQYARLEQRGELSVLRDKWFHPERHHDNASPWLLYVALLGLLLLLVLFLLNRIIGRSVAKKTQRYSEQTRLMNLALDMGGFMVTEYNSRNGAFKNLRGRLIDERTTLEEAMATIHKDDLPAFRQIVEDLKNKNINNSDLNLRRNVGTADEPSWQYLTGNCIREHDDDGQLSQYILVSKDVSSELAEQKANNELAAKYIKAFDISLIAMSFYDADGHLVDLNERMKEVIGVTDDNQRFFQETLLFEAPLFRDVLFPGMRETVHACQHMYYPDINLDKYLEYRIRPVVDDDEIRYYIITVRDITEERRLYREQQMIERQLLVTSGEASKFEMQMNYLLSNSNMSIWRSRNKRRTIDVSHSLHKAEVTFTFDEYINSVAPEERETTREFLEKELSQDQPLNFIRHYSRSMTNHREMWYAVSSTPYHNSEGMVTGHFGVIRDVTNLMRQQEELRQETARAQQSGALKAAFLANMTHEIRTPLNAIVGFSDLLQMTTSPEERTEFIQIIRHNCDLLLRLVDDILETSLMSQKPQSIKPADMDFSAFFDEVCQTVSQRVTEPGVSFVKDNPYPSYPACSDGERLQQVITNFVTNAVKYTHQGHIKVGYREEWREVGGHRQEGLYIYCEDTGAGIPKDKQAFVFDRFVKLNDYVQGTGLGLAICKSIADRCGGQIGVVSEGEGKGSVFWLWVPRYLTLGNLTVQS